MTETIIIHGNQVAVVHGNHVGMFQLRPSAKKRKQAQMIQTWPYEAKPSEDDALHCAMLWCRDSYIKYNRRNDEVKGV